MSEQSPDGALPLTVEWLKWPSSPHRTTPMRRLGSDEAGVWLYAPRGAPATYAGDRPAPLPVNFLTLVPARPTWWIATWMWGNDEIDIELYVDIVAPPEWVAEDRLRVVDLDLDVIRRCDGRVVLDDEEEFADNSIRLAYPDDVVAGARATADEVLAGVRNRHLPFGAASGRWLEVAAQAG